MKIITAMTQEFAQTWFGFEKFVIKRVDQNIRWINKSFMSIEVMTWQARYSEISSLESFDTIQLKNDMLKMNNFDMEFDFYFLFTTRLAYELPECAKCVFATLILWEINAFTSWLLKWTWDSENKVSFDDFSQAGRCSHRNKKTNRKYIKRCESAPYDPMMTCLLVRSTWVECSRKNTLLTVDI